MGGKDPSYLTARHISELRIVGEQRAAVGNSYVRRQKIRNIQPENVKLL